MKAIYEPAGRAKEYADLACNLYTGCNHGCKYCFAPSTKRQTREDFHRNPVPRKEILVALVKDCDRMRGDPRRVNFCFTSDPYQYGIDNITGAALGILGDRDMKAMVLTKQPTLALARDADYFVDYDVWLGTTIVFTSEHDRKEWEPNASPIESRFEALKAAKNCGIHTWVSIEPVIYPEQAIDVIKRVLPIADTIKVGKINYNKDFDSVDWKTFAKQAVELGKDHPDFILKQSLRSFL